ncbi:uncharacterized LOC128706665 homolog isoform X1 [Loxodonta africana]|uniref:uncharacterized LOC128706665 homolog isoform X1 n=1 Tax=Loxodonta africana TaxID=9785 RepID=UPI0030D4057B
MVGYRFIQSTNTSWERTIRASPKAWRSGIGAGSAPAAKLRMLRLPAPGAICRDRRRPQRRARLRPAGGGALERQGGWWAACRCGVYPGKSTQKRTKNTSVVRKNRCQRVGSNS